jgi:proteasome lid subunit RPN8/RPN11
MISMSTADSKPVTMRHPDPFDPDVVHAIKEHAKSEFPKESCGIVTCDGYLPCENIHEDPENAFRIDPEIVTEHTIAGTLLAVVHSHPNGPNYPSFADQKFQIDSGLPWGIVPVIAVTAEDGSDVPVASDIIWWGDTLPIPPLERRMFIWGVFHCYGLYRDWLRLERGVTIMNFPCSEDFIKDGENPFVERAEITGHLNLGKIPMEDLQFGDLVVGKLRGDFPNHCGIYLGGDDLLHHPAGGASCKTNLLRWWPYVDTVLRYDREKAASLRPAG